ncbi:MAG TPA: hypothetical protein VJM50_24780 [Pyrinomonadaceae bacterium]|nr:hypothetical protein [Pyrinomonadaceae bacterium]
MPIYRCVISALVYAQLHQNRIYVRSIDALTEQQVANHIDASWVENIRQPLTNQTQFMNIAVTKVSDPALGAFSKPIQKFGAQGGNEQMIPFVCWKLRFLTGLAGRKFRGRCYVGPIQAGFTSFGVVNGAGIAHWNATLAALRANFIGSNPATGLNLIIHGEQEAHDTTVTDIQLSTQVGVQRRRNIGVGS